MEVEQTNFVTQYNCIIDYLKTRLLKFGHYKFQMVMINYSKLLCKLVGKSKEQILCKLSKSEMLRLYSIVHVAMETTKMSHFTWQSKSFISIFFICQVSACELQPFSCHDLAINDIY